MISLEELQEKICDVHAGCRGLGLVWLCHCCIFVLGKRGNGVPSLRKRAAARIHAHQMFSHLTVRHFFSTTSCSRVATATPSSEGAEFPLPLTVPSGLFRRSG